MYEEFMKMFDNLENIIWQCYYKTEIICGYCENAQGEKISPEMIRSLISEIRDVNMDIINKIDEFTTNQGYKFLKSLETESKIIL